MSIKLNLHSHTLGSPDSVTSMKDIAKLFDDNVLDQIAITDHDEVWFAKQAQKEFGQERIIVGSEVTIKGNKHLIGLFINKEIKKGLDILETAQRIKDQGGLVYAPHPYDPVEGIGEENLQLLFESDLLDIVEGFNAWMFRSILRRRANANGNDQALIFARKHDIPVASASDAHKVDDFQNAYTEVQEVVNEKNILKLLSDSETTYKREFNKVNMKVIPAAYKYYTSRLFKRDKFRRFGEK